MEWIQEQILDLVLLMNGCTLRQRCRQYCQQCAVTISHHIQRWYANIYIYTYIYIAKIFLCNLFVRDTFKELGNFWDILKNGFNFPSIESFRMICNIALNIFLQKSSKVMLRTREDFQKNCFYDPSCTTSQINILLTKTNPGGYCLSAKESRYFFAYRLPRFSLIGKVMFFQFIFLWSYIAIKWLTEKKLS